VKSLYEFSQYVLRDVDLLRRKGRQSGVFHDEDARDGRDEIGGGSEKNEPMFDKKNIPRWAQFYHPGERPLRREHVFLE
jgi:hypothetical protein